jgi:hypothetical protein
MRMQFYFALFLLDCFCVCCGGVARILGLT